MSATPPAPRTWWQRVWFGRDGLRVGWAILLFLVTSAVAIGILGGIARLLHLPFDTAHALTPLGTITNEVTQCAGVLVATWVVSLAEHRSWLSYGLGARHGAFHFAQGAFWGIVLLSVMIAALVLAHAAVVRPSGAARAALFRDGWLWAIGFLLGAGFEELTFRGYLLFRLSHSFNPVAGAIVMSLLFGAAHTGNAGESVIGIAMAVAFGLIGCLAVWRTGSLWWIIGVHAAWDWSETYLYGTADSGLAASGQLLTTHPAGPVWVSGGAVGPEASVIVFPVMALLALAALFILPRTRALPTP
ncbi:MAG TPA: type II CAAX endopeptidase family protein [Rhodanobacteraceae bacterium]